MKHVSVLVPPEPLVLPIESDGDCLPQHLPQYIFVVDLHRIDESARDGPVVLLICIILLGLVVTIDLLLRHQNLLIIHCGALSSLHPLRYVLVHQLAVLVAAVELLDFFTGPGRLMLLLGRPAFVLENGGLLVSQC